MGIPRHPICWLLVIYFICHIIYPSSISFSYPKENHDYLDPIFQGNPKEDGSDIYSEGLKLFMEKKFSMAIVKFKEFQARYPESGLIPLAGILIGDSYLNDGEPQQSRLNDALRVYQEVRNGYTKGDIGAMALLRIGDTYIKLGFSYEAIGSFRRIYSEFPEGRFASIARMRIARSYILSERYQKALKELQIVIDSYPKKNEAIEAYFMKGYVLNHLKKFEEAGRSYQQGLDRWPDYPRSNPTILYDMGENYMTLGKYGMARETFSALANIYPKDNLATKAIMRIADSYSLDGKAENSIKIYKEAVNSFSEDESVKGMKAALEEEETFEAALNAAKQKRYMDAMNAFNELLIKYPNGIRKKEAETAIVGLIKNYITDQHKTGECLNTVMIYRKLRTRIELETMDTNFFSLMGNCHISLGLYKGAAEIYSEAIRVVGLKEDLLYKLGETKFLAGDYGNAIKPLEEFISSYPKSKQLNSVYRYLGISLYKKGDYKKGREILSRWLELYPDSQYRVEGQRYIAGSYIAEGFPEKASTAYRKMLGPPEDPNPDLFIRLGDALFASNDCNGAMAAYKKGLSMGQKGEQADYANYQIGVCYTRTDKSALSKEIFSDLALKSESEIIKKLADERGKLLNKF